MDKHLIDINITHTLQVGVLDKLRHKESVEYAGLIPDGMSGNEFLYHLNKIVSSKLVEKIGKSYKLTPLGLLHSDVSSYDTNKLKLRPVIGVFLYLKNTAGKQLVFESLRAPLFGYIGLPFGKLRLGESTEQVLDRVLAKRGIKRSDVSVAAYNCINVKYTQGTELVAHRCGVVAECVYLSESTPELATHNGRSYFECVNESPAELFSTIHGSADVDVILKPK